MNTEAVIAISVSVGTLGTQIGTLAQVWKLRGRAEKFEDRQREANREFERRQTEANQAFSDQQRTAAEESAAQLADAAHELTRVFNLQTRWDPVRLQTYGEVWSHAVELWPIAAEFASLRKHGELVLEDKETGRMDAATYRARSDELSRETDTANEKWSAGYRALQLARSRVDLIASQAVRDAVTRLVHSIEAMSKASAYLNQGGDYESEFYSAQVGLQNAVRLELGSDHYATEHAESS